MERKRKDEPETNLLIFGPPGAGKGTYASRLAAELRITSLATGDIFRQEIREQTALGMRIVEFVENGLLVPDEIVIEVLKERISRPNSDAGFILDGFPRTIDQAKALDKIATIDAIVHLVVPEWVIVERLSNRRICRNCGAIYNIKYAPKPKFDLECDNCGGDLYQREDDKAEVISERLRVYETQTQPLIEYYKEKETPFVTIVNKKVDAPIDIIFQRILEGLRKIKII